MIIAHRGISFDLPENSLSAFNASWAVGVDGIEGDFHLTRDGSIVCIHDDNTSRVCNKNLVICNSTLQELKELNLQCEGKNHLNIKIPTLTEVLKTVPSGKKIFVEIKCGVEILSPLIKELSRSKINSNQVVIISFDRQVVKELKEMAPEYKALLLYSYEEGREVSSLINEMFDIKADGIGTDNELSKEFVEKVIISGLEYHSWTIDNADTANQLISWGSNSITTNEPELLIQ
jgi:glycerophosphoryl diester phosphodiesterase|tara:strand:+ start:2476 stop:3174 length:699 start_codon:yes stop_codon:yes gene_type:complete